MVRKALASGRCSINGDYVTIIIVNFFIVKQSIDIESDTQGYPGGAVVKNLPANVGDTGLSPGPGSSHMPQSN